MKKIRNLLIVFSVIFLNTFNVSCSKDESVKLEDNVSILNMPSNESNKSSMIELGKKLKNPYSVKNMKLAMQSLKRKSIINKEFDLKTTHLYVKFKPKTVAELDIIKRDTTLILYSYPLDVELIEGGSYYRDPEVPLDQPTYQYCSIPITKNLSEEVAYEILEELYIPEGSSDLDIISKNNNSFNISQLLVEESLLLTDNIDVKQHNSISARSSWTPAGYVRVYDDSKYTFVGVEGVEVRARRWFTTYKGLTNSLGYFACNGTFTRDANYSIDWERYDFALQDGWLNGATYNGPKITGNWIPDLSFGVQKYYATIFKAANHYFYKNIFNLRRPPLNSTWKTKLRIRAYDEENTGENGKHSPLNKFVLDSPIKIYNPQNHSQDIYGTVIHEIAHASHWNIDPISYSICSDKVSESWARGVQWKLTSSVYANYRPDYFKNYTGLVEDLIDNNFSYKDKVNGYTIRQIEDQIDGVITFMGWKNLIKSNYENTTEIYLDELFDYWNSL